MTRIDVARAEGNEGRLSVDLTLAEAVPLAAALVDATARRIDVRALLIKGPTLAHYGLRSARLSADVDLLIEPGGMKPLTDALVTLGWRERAAEFPGQVDAPHARTLVHPDWPCDVDLHRFFPGLMADPTESFEALWSVRKVMSLANMPCAIPDEVGSALVYRLSLLRAERGHEGSDLDEWARSLTKSQRDELQRLIAQTGSGIALSGSPAPWAAEPSATTTSGPRSAAQRRRALTGAHGYIFWRHAYRQAAPFERIRALVSVALNGRRADWRRAARGAARLLGREGRERR